MSALAFAEPVGVKQLSESFLSSVLTDIYQEDKNIVVWRRILSPELVLGLQQHLREHSSIRLSMVVSPDRAADMLNEAFFRVRCRQELVATLAQLVDMFCCLFEQERVGLRLTTLDQAMCPRFHVDKVPCRLVTTLTGSGTQWLPEDGLNRSRLGAGSAGLPDERSGLFESTEDIRQLTVGDVALLKGERWAGNENRGLVHRSPPVVSAEKRLLLTLDFAD